MDDAVQARAASGRRRGWSALARPSPFDLGKLGFQRLKRRHDLGAAPIIVDDMRHERMVRDFRDRAIVDIPKCEPTSAGLGRDDAEHMPGELLAGFCAP